MAKFPQKSRAAAITTPLGPDALGLEAIQGHESISNLFEYTIELASDDPNLDFDKLIGETVSIRLERGRGGTRYFHGHVASMDQLASERRYARYRMTVVPWLWFLTRTSDCRIYQDKTIPQIIEELFRRHKLGEYELRLTGKHPAWEYCVQYRETDFNFISRLMEQEGIFYFFSHEKGRHKLILADNPSAHESVKGYEKLLYRPQRRHGRDDEQINEWTVRRELQTGHYEHTDYDFEMPRKELRTNQVAKQKHAQSKLAIYDYPGEYNQPEDGPEYAKIRLQEIQANSRVARGEADARGLAAGYCFTLAEHPRKDQCVKQLVLSTQIAFRVGAFDSEGSDRDDGPFFHCSFRAIDASIPFRPSRRTPKPLVQGVQTATVVGPKGKEVHLDTHSRVKVHFHWDRHDQRDENSSCWVRVSQAWAGGTYGGLIFPRIGQEVVVSFLEGDPDQPLITGRVYNGDQMPPPSNAGREDTEVRASREWAKSKKEKAAQVKQQREARKAAIAPVTPATGSTPPAPPPPVEVKKSASILDGLQKVMSVLPPNPFNQPPATVVETFMMSSLKSSSLDGASGTNEITMNDAGGLEGLFVKAQKDNINTVGNDRETTIANDELVKIGNDRTETVGNDEQIEIGNDRSEHVGNDEQVDIRNDRHETVGNNEDIEIGNDRTEHVKNDEKITIGHDRIEKVGNDENIAITGNRTEKVGKDENITIVGAQTITIKKNTQVTITDGDLSHTVKAGKADYNIKKDLTEKVEGNQSTTVKNRIAITSESAEIEVSAANSIVLKVGGSQIYIDKTTIALIADNITIEGGMIGSSARELHTILGNPVNINP